MTKLTKLALGAILLSCKLKECLAANLLPGCGYGKGGKRKWQKEGDGVGFASDVNNSAIVSDHSLRDTALAGSIGQSNHTGEAHFSTTPNVSLVDRNHVGDDMTKFKNSNSKDAGNSDSLMAVKTDDNAEATAALDLGADATEDGTEDAHDDAHHMLSKTDRAGNKELVTSDFADNSHSRSIVSGKSNLFVSNNDGDSVNALVSGIQGVTRPSASRSQALPIVASKQAKRTGDLFQVAGTSNFVNQNGEPVQLVRERGTKFNKDENSSFYYDSRNIQFKRTGDLYVKTSSDAPIYYDSRRKQVDLSETVDKTAFRIHFDKYKYYDEKNNRFTRKGDTFIRDNGSGLVFTTTRAPLNLKRHDGTVYLTDPKYPGYFYDKKFNKYKKVDGLYKKDQDLHLYTKYGEELECYADDDMRWSLWKNKEKPVDLYDKLGTLYEAVGDLFVTEKGKMLNREGNEVRLEFVNLTAFSEDKNSPGTFYDQSKIQYKKRNHFYEIKDRFSHTTLYDDMGQQVTFTDVPGTIFTSTGKNDGFYYFKRHYTRVKKVGVLYITDEDYFDDYGGGSALYTASGNLVAKDPKEDWYESIANGNESTLRFSVDRDGNFARIVQDNLR